MDIIEYFVRGLLISILVMFTAATFLVALELLANKFDLDNKRDKFFWSIIILIIILIGSIFSK
jgi:FtsH-binding integral membrane protein